MLVYRVCRISYTRVPCMQAWHCTKQANAKHEPCMARACMSKVLIIAVLTMEGGGCRPELGKVTVPEPF